MMEGSNFIAVSVSGTESLPSADNIESEKRECVNTMQHDEHHQDLNKANGEHTTHVHTLKTADFVENELVSNLQGIQPHFANDVFMLSSEDASNDAVQFSISNPDTSECFDTNIGMETEVHSMSTNTVEIGDETETNASSVVDDSEENKKEKFDIQKLNYELQVGYKILMSLMGAGNRFVNKLFLHPVDANFPETSEYYSKIKEPMWMHKMKDKFEDLQYNDLTDFMADFKLMIENCYRFNGPDNFVSKKAQKLETMMKQKIALLSKELRTKIMGASNTDDEMLASAGIRRRVRNPNLAGEDESQILLSQLRRDKAIQEREDRRQRVEDRKALEAARIQEIQDWEDEFVGPEVKESLQTMWELPQIGMFVYLCMECLGLDEEVTQFQLERGLAAPRECSDFRRLMTCLLSTQNQRRSVKSYMPYTVWNKKLSQKLDHFYKVLSDCGGNQQQACYKLGFDNRAFKVLGKSNPLLKRQFHQMSFLKRVWVLKCYCDQCVESQTYLQKTIEEKEAERPMDVREVLLGSDGRGYRYVNFPMFTGKDIRIYRHPKLQEPSLNSLGMEGWSMVEEKPSASSSRCSTPVNQKRCSEPQSSSLRARAIMQAAESNDPSPVRASPDIMQDENSNSNQGASSVSSEPNANKGSSSSYKRRKRSGYTGKRKRLKNSAASRKELLMMDEFTDSPGTGTEKEEDGGSVRGDDNDDSQGFNVPKFNSVKDNGIEKTCDNNASSNANNNGSNDNNTSSNGCDKDNVVDTKAESNVGQSKSAAVPSSECFSSSSASSIISSANNVETLPSLSQIGIVGKGSEKSHGSSSEEQCDGSEVMDTSEGVKISEVNQNDNGTNDIEMKETAVSAEKAASMISECGKVVTESSSSEIDSSDVSVNKNQDSAYVSCDSDKSFQNKEKPIENVTKEAKMVPEDKNINSLDEDKDKSDVKNVSKVECNDNGDHKEIKPKVESSDVKSETLPSNVKQEAGEKDDSSASVKSEEVLKNENSEQNNLQQSELKTEKEEVKEEPVEEESDEEDLPDLGRIELVAESMEGIRNLMNKLQNPDPIKRGKRVYPGVIKPCEEELLENLTRFHDELVKYEKSLFNARVHAQIKLRKEVDSYVEPKVEESKGWESETSQSSKNASDDEEETAGGSDAPGSNSKKEKQQKVASTPSASSKKPKKSMTEFLSSAASKLASLNGDANNEDSNDSYELDISSRGRLRKRRVIPNNTEDTLLKKRKNLNQDTPTTDSTPITTSTAPLLSSQSPLSSPTSVSTATMSGIHSLNQSQILSMLASSQSNLALPGNKPSTTMPCQIVRFVSPSGDASSYRTVRFISPGAGGKPNMVLASPEKFASAGANIQFVSSTGVVTIPRSKLLASSLTSTTQSSHPVIQNLLKSQGKVPANQVIFQKNVNLPAGTSGIRQQQQGGEQRLLSKMLSSNIRMTNAPTVGVAGVVSGQVKQQQQLQRHPAAVMKPVATPSSTAASAAVVVTQVSNSFISQGGKQVLDLGNLSVTQIQQLVKNQAIQINTGAGNSTTLLLTTGLQQLSAAAAASGKGGAVGSVAGVATTTLASAGAAGHVNVGGVQHQIKVPVPNIAGFSNAATMGKNLVGQQQQHMTVIPRNSVNTGNKNSSQLPVIRTIINRPALNTVRTSLPVASQTVLGQNASVIGLNQQQQQQQVPGLFTIVSGVGATALKQIPAGTHSVVNNNQTTIRMSTSIATPSHAMGQNNLVPSIIPNNPQQQQLFTIVSGSGAALKQIPAPRIISSLNQNVVISSSTAQGPNDANNVNASNKENPLSNSNSVVNHSNPKSSTSTTPTDTLKHNWVTIPTRKYAGNVTVKALLENRNATKKSESDSSNMNSSGGDEETGHSSDNTEVSNGIQSETKILGSKTDDTSYVNIPSQPGPNESTSSQHNISSLPSSSVSTSNTNAHTQQILLDEAKKESLSTVLSSSSSVPVTQSLSVDAAIQPLLVSSLQVTLPTVNIKVPSPNTLPSMTHNKNSTTIVQSTKVPIHVASTVESYLSPATQITNTTSSIASGVATAQTIPLPQSLPANQFTITTTTAANNSNVNSIQTVITPAVNSSNNNISTILTPKSHPQTQMVLNLNNVINNSNLNASNTSNNNPADLKNVMLKLTPPKGGTGQFVQGYMTSQGKLVIPQAALFPQQQQQQQQQINQQQAQVLQTGPTRVILANHNALSTSQPNQILHTAAKIPTALLGGNNGSSQVRLAAPNSNDNNSANGNVNSVLNVGSQTPTGMQIVGQQNNQLVLAAAQQLHQASTTPNLQQQANSIASCNLSARAIPVQSGNPGIKLMLINPSAVSGLQNNPIQNIQQQQQQQQVVKVNRSIGSAVGSMSVVPSPASQQNQQAVQTSTPASELVKQIAANSTQLHAVTVQQQQNSSGGNNLAAGKSTQQILQQVGNTVSSQSHIPGSQSQTNLAAQILTLQQQSNKIQQQQIHGGQIVLTKPQQQQQQTHQSSQQPGAISLQLQNVGQLLSSQNVSIRGLAPQQIQVPNPQLHHQQGAQGTAGAPKPIPPAQMVQLAINAQNASAGQAGTVVAQPRVVQVAGQLSPQIQLANQNPLQATVMPQLIIQQQQPNALLQSTKQLIGTAGGNVVQLQQNNSVIQQQPPTPKPMVVQQQQLPAAHSSISIQQQQKQQQQHPQLLTNPQTVRQQQQQPMSLPSALSTNPVQIQNQNQSQAQIQFVINPSAVSTANLARLAKPVIHPVIRAVATSPSSSSTLSSSSSLPAISIPTSLKSSSSSSRPQQIVLSQNLPPPSPSSSNQFIISPIKLGNPQAPQGTPQTRLISPLKLVTPVQTILQQPGASSLTDQRTSQLVMQNTSQLQNILQNSNSKFISPAISNTQPPRPAAPSMIASTSLADNNKIGKPGNVCASTFDNSTLNQSSLNFKPQNIVVAAASGTSPQPPAPLVVSVNGSVDSQSSSWTSAVDNSGLNHQNGIDSGGAGFSQQSNRRNTFCGSQEVPKMVAVQRQKSADESMTSDENDEKEAALNLLTLANQPL